MTVRRAATWGFVAGLASSVAYLAAGGDTFWSIPLWADILFYTGFFTGTMVHFSLGPAYNAPEIIGCLTVAITYSLLFGLVFKVYQYLFGKRLRGHSQSGTLKMATAEDEQDSADQAGA